MLIHSASQLLTFQGGIQRGNQFGQTGLIEDGAVLIEDGQIVATGTSVDLMRDYPQAERFDARGKVVMPGFVDPHTHLIFMGSREMEFEMRLEGKTYMEIMAVGGGILNTVKATRLASVEQLKESARLRMHSMIRHGTTTAEAKSGYGLEIESELRQMHAILELDAEGGLELVPTFLGAHAIAPEFEHNPDGFTKIISESMLTRLKEWWLVHAAGKELPFVDVFCEKGAFSLEQSRVILERARDLGFPLKMHVDEFENLGGASLAVELGATSADHLVKTSAEDMRVMGASDVVAVALPATPFGLGQVEFTPAQQIVEAGGILAIASDLNPGTAWCENMQFVVALACRYLHLTVAQALAAATINAAAAIARQDQIGSLEAGKQADLLVLNGADYRNLGYRFGANQVWRVMKRGKWVIDNGES